MRSLVVLLAACGCGGSGSSGSWTFTDATAESGLVLEFEGGRTFSGGVAAGDYDGDGFDDLYLVGSTNGVNLLFRNLGDGTFEEVGVAAGVAVTAARRCGPSFADYDGDGFLDLFLGGVRGMAPILFRNQRDGTFLDVSVDAGLVFARADTYGAAWADYDQDGDLDLFTCHYGNILQTGAGKELLWRNDDGVFVDVSDESGITAVFLAHPEWIFTPNFADLDADGSPDLLLASDFGASRVLMNNRDGTFRDATTGVIDDENGMGAAIGDYDNDGDLDWFVSSIHDSDGVAEGNWGVTGNRLYRNDGTGTFADATDVAGVARGFWGWGSCFADLNNDGWLDIFHVNGNVTALEPEFFPDPSRLFLARGDGSFLESSAARGIVDFDRGLGVVCFDYDRDGDLDLVTWNSSVAPRLYRNNGGNQSGFLEITLRAPANNTAAIGAWVRATHAGKTQVREIRAGNNFISQNPARAWFGLGPSPGPVDVAVDWPDGAVTLHAAVAPNQHLILRHPSLP